MLIKIDASNCKNIIEGYASFGNSMCDYWYYQSLSFESGKLYALISEHQQGCMYLSYLLGGNIEFEDGLKLYMDDTEIKNDDLKEISWNLEPLNEPYKNKKVRKSIERALKAGGRTETFEQISDIFYLTESRYDKKLKYLSGERWRASAALGYALGKRIFYAPYCPSNFYYEMSRSNMFKVFEFLSSRDCLMVLPVGSDVYLKSCVDECIYIKQEESYWDKA